MYFIHEHHYYLVHILIAQCASTPTDYYIGSRILLIYYNRVHSYTATV
jgi:hypothetical protein